MSNSSSHPDLVPPRKFIHGWQPDMPDHRDYKFAARFKGRAALPSKVSLLKQMPSIYHQGDLGSCTAQAIAAAMAFLKIKDDMIYFPYSRLFIYYNERAMEGTVKYDAGAQIRDGIKSVHVKGACSEELWPYDVTMFAKRPNRDCYNNAKDSQTLSYFRLDNSRLYELKKCLADGFPFVFGFAVYDSFESDAVAKSGKLNLPTPSEQLLGGHAVLCIGYDDATDRFLVRNSWGDSWGKGGYFTMPYSYLTNRDLSDDFWTIRSEE